MSEKADIWARVKIFEGDDERQITGTTSDRVVVESIFRTVKVIAATAGSPETTVLDLFSMNTDTGPKAVFVRTTKEIQVHFNGTAGGGNQLRDNGFMVIDGTNITVISLVNVNLTNASTVTVGAWLFSTA